MEWSGQAGTKRARSRERVAEFFTHVQTPERRAEKIGTGDSSSGPVRVRYAQDSLRCRLCQKAAKVGEVQGGVAQNHERLGTRKIVRRIELYKSVSERRSWYTEAA